MTTLSPRPKPSASNPRRVTRGPRPSSRLGAGQGGRRALSSRTEIIPHWFDDNTRFWYRNDLAAGAREFIVVDAVKGTRVPAFDHKRLAAAVAKAAGQGWSRPTSSRSTSSRSTTTRRSRAVQGGRHRLEVRPRQLRVLQGPGRRRSRRRPRKPLTAAAVLPGRPRRRRPGARRERPLARRQVDRLRQGSRCSRPARGVGRNRFG